jgi:hypothetical protein
MTRNKQRVTINLSSEIVEKARITGLNLSTVCENALISMLTRLDTSISENKRILRNPISEGELVPRPGFEPGTIRFLLYA